MAITEDPLTKDPGGSDPGGTSPGGGGPPTGSTPTPVTPPPSGGYRPQPIAPTIPPTPHNPVAGGPIEYGIRGRGDRPRPGGPGSPPPPPPLPDPPPGKPGSDPVPQPTPTSIPSRTDTFIPPLTDPVHVMYGPFHKGGQLFMEEVTSDGGTLVGWIVGHGPINSIDVIEIEGQNIGIFGAEYHVHLTNDGVDSLINTYHPTIAANPSKPVAYVTAKFPAGALPPNFHSALFTGTGLLVYDPETDATLTTKYYRPYPPLCLADYLQSVNYGRGEPKTAVYGSASLVKASQRSYLDIGGGVHRYICSVILNQKRASKDNCELIRMQGALQYQYNSGVWQYWVDEALTSDEIAAAIVLTDVTIGAQDANINNAGPLMIAGKIDVPTQVRGNFVNAPAAYKDDFANYPEDADLTVGVELIQKSYDFGMLPVDQVKRLIKQYYKASQNDQTVPVRVLPDGGELVLPGVPVVVTAQQVNYGAVLCRAIDWSTSSDPMMPMYWEGHVKPYVAGVYDDTILSATPYVPPANPSPFEQPPDVINPVGTVTADTATLYFDAPVDRSAAMYGGSAWTPTNLTSFTASKVNDGDIINPAFGWNATGASSLILDMGSAKNIREVWIYYQAIVSGFVPGMDYSNDGSTWTLIAGGEYNNITLGSGIIFRPRLVPASIGAFRYLRFRKPVNVANGTVITEIWPREYTANVYPNLIEYRIYGQGAGFIRGNLYARIPALPQPSTTHLIDVNPIAVHIPTTYNTDGDDSFGVTIVAVSAAQVESMGMLFGEGVTTPAFGTQAPATVQASQVVTLTNGLNSNIVTAPGRGLIEIAGPTAAFSIGGLTNPQAGERVRILNSLAFAMTIKYEDGSSAAANRIQDTQGVDLVLAAGTSFVDLEYSATRSRFIVKAARDNTGPR